MPHRLIHFYQKYKYYIPYLGLALLMWPNLISSVFNFSSLPDFWRYVFLSLGVALLLPHFLINSFIPNLRHHKVMALLQLLVMLVSLFIIFAPEKFFIGKLF